MKKIGFLGAYDKTNFIIYTAKILRASNYKVLVVDTSSVQKTKYIVPSINPTKSYITSFETIDFAIGFESWDNIERYLGVSFDSNDETEEMPQNDIYDYILVDVDSAEMLESFEMENADKNYFVTSFDLFSLRKGMNIFRNLQTPIELTKVLFTYELTKEDEDYLNYVAMEYKINWNEYTIYFQIYGEDNKVFEENQRLEKIRFRRLSANYKESITYVIQDIDKNSNPGMIKKIMKD